MNYKILEVNIKFNHPHDDYVIAVAIESSPGYWKAYTKQVNEISNKSLLEVARAGSKLPKQRALEMFETCRHLQKQKRIVFEG